MTSKFLGTVKNGNECVSHVYWDDTEYQRGNILSLDPTSCKYLAYKFSGLSTKTKS